MMLSSTIRTLMGGTAPSRTPGGSDEGVVDRKDECSLSLLNGFARERVGRDWPGEEGRAVFDAGGGVPILWMEESRAGGEGRGGGLGTGCVMASNDHDRPRELSGRHLQSATVDKERVRTCG